MYLKAFGRWMVYTRLILVVAMMSCSSDELLIDTTAPTITVTKPEMLDMFNAGESIPLQATFTDDYELSQFKIDIHSNFEGHDHGRIVEMVDPTLLDWFFSENYDFPAGTRNITISSIDDIQIPDNALAGLYHFIVTAVDQSSNVTNFQDGSTIEQEIFIRNASQSKIEISNLVNDELEIEVGVVFDVEGKISDELPLTGDYAGIDQIQIVLAEPHEDNHDHEGRLLSESDLFEKEYNHEELEAFYDGPVISLNLIFQDIKFTLSAVQAEELVTEGIDHLELDIEVKDKQGNHTKLITIVHIHND